MMSLKSHLLIFFSPAKGLRPRIFLVIFLILAIYSTYYVSTHADDFIQQSNSELVNEGLLSVEAEKKADEAGIVFEDGKIVKKTPASPSTVISTGDAAVENNQQPNDTPDDNQPVDNEPDISSLVAFYADNQSDSDADDLRHENVVNRILTTSANPVIHAGDILEDGTLDSWNRFLNIAGPLLSTRTFYAALGNNDRVVGDSATPSPYFLNYFNFPNNERWYSVNSGNLHIVVLDSAFSWGSAEQLSWLASDLQSADSQSRITVVVYHHPTFASVIDTQLINYGVDFVVSGHIHAYSKNYSNGIYFFTLPGGTSIGHALATINENSATITFYNSDGNAIETTTINER